MCAICKITNIFYESLCNIPLVSMCAIWYNVITVKERGVVKLIDKIKELEKLVAQLNKLLLKVIELLGTVTLAALAIKSLIELI